MIGVLSDASDEDHGAVRQYEGHKPSERDEVNRPHRLSIEQLTEPTQLVGDRRALHHASGDRDRRGDENSDEVAELLQAVIAGPTLVDWEVQRRVLDRRRECGREHIRGLRHQPPPLISGKQQHIKGGAIDYPEQVDGEMPPPRQPKSMAKARNAKPSRQSDRVVLSGPNPPLRHRDLEAKPIRPRCAVPPPIKPRMVSQNLQASSHDEQHEKHVEKMLEL